MIVPPGAPTSEVAVVIAAVLYELVVGAFLTYDWRHRKRQRAAEAFDATRTKEIQRAAEAAALGALEHELADTIQVARETLGGEL